MRIFFKTCLVILGIGFVGMLEAAPSEALSPETTSQSAPATSQVNESDKININIADEKTIANAINGIGAKRARAIVEYRDKNGFFTSLEDLAKVKGISAKFVKNRLAELQGKFTIG